MSPQKNQTKPHPNQPSSQPKNPLNQGDQWQSNLETSDIFCWKVPRHIKTGQTKVHLVQSRGYSKYLREKYNNKQAINDNSENSPLAPNGLWLQLCEQEAVVV